MIEIICEVWCSPLRSEHYSLKCIPLSIGDSYHFDTEIQEYFSGNFYYDAFGENHHDVKGLFKIVCKVKFEYINYYDWEGIPDCDVEACYEELFKSQCVDWQDVKYTWLSINNKMEDYFNKPYKKHLGLYQ